MLLGLVGFAGAGKDTVANVLVEEYGFQKFSFASALKDAAASIFGWDRKLLEGDSEESRLFRETPDKFWSIRFGYDLSPRTALQLLGTESGREVFHENIWIYSLERKIMNVPNVVISDVRFKNEIDFVQSKNGFLVRVSRGKDPEWYDTAYDHNVNGKYEMRKKYPDVHLSEWSWIGTKFDYVIDNSGSKAEIPPMLSHMTRIFTGPILQTA